MAIWASTCSRRVAALGDERGDLVVGDDRGVVADRLQLGGDVGIGVVEQEPGQLHDVAVGVVEGSIRWGIGHARPYGVCDSAAMAESEPELDALDAVLRSDIRRLGAQLGDALVRQHGSGLLDRVERVRAIARELRREQASTTELVAALEDVDLVDAIHLVRAFTVYFHLANTAEQVHRVDELKSARAQDRRFPETVARLQALGHHRDEIVDAAARLDLRPVFTAHPTEASRRSILDKLAEISTLIEQRGDARAGVTDHRRIDRRVDELIDAIWLTDELRRAQPSPEDEARSILYFLGEMVVDGLPELLGDVDATLRDLGSELGESVPVRFGSWVGGDRDGNPNVTPATTLEVLEFQRSRALRILIAEDRGSVRRVVRRLAGHGHHRRSRRAARRRPAALPVGHRPVPHPQRG